MARRAEWRRLPDDPKTAFGRLRAWADEGDASMSLTFLVGLIVPALLAFIFLGTRLRAFAGIVAAVCGLFLSLFVLAGYEERTRRRRRKPLKRLLPRPLPPATFPVELTLRYRGALTGRDHAAASFVDGWLHIDGRRTGFSLCAEDGRGEWRDRGLRIDFPDGRRLVLSLVDDPEPEARGAYFRHAASLWIADRERPEGESILPPLGVHPVARAGRTFTTLAGIVVPYAVGGVLMFHVSGLAVVETVLATNLLALASVARALIVGARSRAEEGEASEKRLAKRLTPRV